MKAKNQKEWNNWKWQLRNSHKRSQEENSVEKIFPVRVTPYYESLIDQSKIPNDPIYKQAFPDERELENSRESNLDPLSEESQMAVPHLIHRYRDRVVLLTTNLCALHCRFCLRKRKWKENAPASIISDTELDAIENYLKQHNEVNEVLVSGGDPLMLETKKLKNILSRLTKIRSVNIIRLGTRAPVVLPMRIDKNLVDMLEDIPGLWIATHFNHPKEVSTEALEACSKLQKRGIPILNQTVLLKGINDDKETLISLFQKLAANRIKPHYLFHMDPVAGNAHFATGIDKGVELIRDFRNTLSSIETPLFAFDLPEGGGKVPLLPNYEKEGKFESLDGKYIEYK